MMSDTYTRRARIYPALIAVLPVTLTAVLLGMMTMPWWSAISALVIGSGLWVLLAQVGRHIGKRREDELFRLWGGAPTTALLRHHGAHNAVRLEGLHRSLEDVTGLTFPTATAEAADPSAADAIYEAAVDELRGATRNHREYPLVFDELCNYGFRRNLWGLRTWAIRIALLTAVGLIAGWLAAFDPLTRIEASAVMAIAGLNLAVALAWSLWVTPDWVHQPATAYAQRLLESAGLVRQARLGSI